MNLKKKTNKTRKQSAPATPQPKPHCTLETSPSQSLKEPAKTFEPPKRQPWKTWNRYASLLTFIATCAYTIVAWFQWRAIENTNDITKQNQTISQRPWMDVVAGPSLDDDSMLDQIQWQIDEKNFGSSPALDVRSSITLFRENDDTRDDITSQIEKQLSELQVSPKGIVVQTGQTTTSTHSISGKLSVKDKYEALHGSGSLFLLVKIYYKDTYHQEHHTVTCRRWLGSKDYGSCGIADDVN